MDIDVFSEIYYGVPQQGPGTDEDTGRALERLVPDSLGPEARILDVGCGLGRQTLVLARRTNAPIIAVDLEEPALDGLRERAAEAGLAGRIETSAQSMDALDFSAGSFDLIWSEGAIYIVGFSKGLELWRPLLKPGGHLAVTEISWLTPNPPAEALAFWDEDYPAMTGIDANLASAVAAGYAVKDHFTLGPDAWEQYYGPLDARISMIRQKYENDPAAQQECDAAHHEIDIYRRFGDSYSYVFYLLSNRT